MLITNLHTLKCIADPFRIELLSRLQTPHTITELSQIYNKSCANINYHVKQLEHSGFLSRNNAQIVALCKSLTIDPKIIDIKKRF